MESIAKSQKRPKLIDAIEKFQLSGAYPVFFAILCVISGLGNKYFYLPILAIFALCVLFSVFFVRDDRVFLVPMLMIYFSIGADKPHAFADSKGELFSAFDPDGLIGICILAAIIIVPYVIRFIVKGAIPFACKEGKWIFWGIIALDVSIIIGGLFSPHFNLISILYGSIIAIGGTLFFIIGYYIIKHASSDIIPYTCRILVIACLLISAQVAVVAIKAHLAQDLLIYHEGSGRWIVQRIHFCFPWGMPTVIGAMAALGIPAAMYMAKNEKHPILYYLSSLLFFAVSLIVNTRSAMIVGGIALLISAVAICFSGRNKRSNRVLSSVFFAAIAVALSLFFYNTTKAGTLNQTLTDIYKLLRFDSINDRIQIFKAGFDDFLSFPIFGVGWDKGALDPTERFNNFFSNMYHSLIIQIGASTGIIGSLAFLNHAKDIAIIGFKKICIDRFLILAVPVMILCMSLVDNFFFYLEFQIPYVVFLALAEKHLEYKKALDTVTA